MINSRCPICHKDTYVYEVGVKWFTSPVTHEKYLADVWRCRDCGLIKVSKIYIGEYKVKELDIENLEKRMREDIKSIGE